MFGDKEGYGETWLRYVWLGRVFSEIGRLLRDADCWKLFAEEGVGRKKERQLMVRWKMT